MISRELFSRLRAGLRAGQFQDGKVEWRGDIGAPRFKLKAMWATPASFGAQERWRVSFSCHHKTIIVETRKPRARLTLVRSQAS
ncbi:MAG TPA: hypothetical protein VGX71_17410 [Pseudaminobacter sp.]|nr:hypothetical protein [Pseudaminobacter sp.]